MPNNSFKVGPVEEIEAFIFSLSPERQDTLKSLPWSCVWLFYVSYGCETLHFKDFKKATTYNDGTIIKGIQRLISSGLLIRHAQRDGRKGFKYSSISFYASYL